MSEELAKPEPTWLALLVGAGLGIATTALVLITWLSWLWLTIKVARHAWGA